jgi:hypothetical protein
MFGNNQLSTVMYGTDKIYGQGYDPLDPNNEVKIYIPGEAMEGIMGQMDISGDSCDSSYGDSSY